MTIYTIRTTSGREDIVIDLLASRVKAENLDIKSLFHPAEIKGYVFAEGPLGAVHKAIQGMMHIRGIIEKSVKLGEIQHFLEYTKARIRIDINDMVEIIGGPFKGERGKVKRIDKVKGEVTIELLEASIPIPVTIATEFVKIVKRAKPEEPPEEKPKKKPEEEVGLPAAEEIREKIMPEEKPEAGKPAEPEKKKISMEELRKELSEEEISGAEAKKAKQIPEEVPEKEHKTILEELEEEEKKKKKKKLEKMEGE